MSKTEKLLTTFASARNAGGGIHTSRELASMLGEKHTPAFVKFLADCAKKGITRRLARDIFESTITPPDPTTAIYTIAKKLRNGVLCYVSLESQLSHTGHISQIIMERITLMTKGRNGIFTTPYGVIEFIHTKKSVHTIMPNLYLDPEISMYRAKTQQAIMDLKSCKRNLHMLEL